MLSEVDDQDDINAWANKTEEELQARNDPSSVASDNLNRIASFIGEKTLIASSTGIIKELVESKIDWKHRVAGYLFLGMISEACTETFLKNMDDVVRMSANGLLDEHPRVRYEALTSLGLLLTSLAPDA